MARKVPEWIGKTDDAPVPDRVRLRIFEREGGICHISKRKIQPGEKWDLDHKVALINEGQHRESNLFPALRDKHREKTAEDVAEKAVVAHTRKRHVGITKPAGTIKSAGFSKSAKPPKVSRHPPAGMTEIQRRYGA
ncbi:HNHc domain containing protein [uncultured Caudovirales phage]|uniref:HNHc domain containing protein n=1 Tax=uncultured Caudovirales phage TaxID=2100421 RepID=A0A6J5MJP2_9CAUD|nr:HNHc domain containing protein [uncultured Caudovirales phage]CAB4176867.1 HNHc domain containing protein [uncultured Caudovirales phage]CAB4190009.1 HNHc domain containing protein [uncultured Caudovirales phage]